MSSHDDFVFVDRQIADTFQSDGHRRAIAVDGLGSSLPQAYELRASDSYMPLEITANLLADGPSVTKQIGPIVGTLAALLFLYDKLSGSLDAVVAESAGYGAGWMIVSRMQDHIVETSDGHIHVLLNRGTDLGLTMISTSDDGDSWSISQLIDDSGKTSTSDIRLLEGTDDLVMTFVTDDEYVAYATMSYDLETGSWAEEDVFLLDHLEYSARSVHPTITVLSNGRILIGYTEQVGEGLRITLSWSDDSGATWDDAVIER
ncbi:MAG: hypothetical protein JKX69_11270, partial [Rhodobacteraceae bacterium]|nr:hypothetical protein [Paracoccaceae bacterium]